MKDLPHIIGTINELMHATFTAESDLDCSQVFVLCFVL